MTGLYRLGGQAPSVHEQAWVAPGASLIGAVSLDALATVWFGAALRGDNEPISIGARSNIQDLCVLHTDPGFPLVVEEGCTIGHRVILHGCTIGAGALIGMGATVLNGARIGPRCLVGAGALVTEGKVFEEGSLILGAPAKAARRLSETDFEMLAAAAQSYVDRAARYRAELAAL